MNSYQLISVCLLLTYYTAYIIKLLAQKKRGIQTSQLGKGNIENGMKDKRTLLVERIVMGASFAIVVSELISIIINKHMIDNSAIRILGIIFVGLGCASFITGMITMRDSWRAGIPDTDKTELIQVGIYKYSRNPAFLGFDLTYIGILLTFFNVILCFITIVTIVAFHFLILEEEKFLTTTFGHSYVDYKKKVGRYFLF